MTLSWVRGSCPRTKCGSISTADPAHVLPGSIIISDMWRAYDSLPSINESLRVNHPIGFINPETGAHTSTIESIYIFITLASGLSLGGLKVTFRVNGSGLLGVGAYI